MSPSLVLNHSFLEGMLQRGAAAQRQPLVELKSTLERIRRVRGSGTFHVHSAISSLEVEPGKTFVSWANQNLRLPEWKETLEFHMHMLGGPFYYQLEVDELPCPVDTLPSCERVPHWLREMVLHCAHHVLCGAGRAWLISYGDGTHLTEGSYRAQRDGNEVVIPNLRNDKEAHTAEAELALAGMDTVIEVLQKASKLAERVFVLPSAEESARRYRNPFSVDMLSRAITGLDDYAKALDSGQGRELAAQSYQLACGIEMSAEKTATLQRPNLRRIRTFRLPDRSEQLFDMHAKPGHIRVHIHARKEPRKQDDPSAGEHTVVYVGHCGEHLPLK